MTETMSTRFIAWRFKLVITFILLLVALLFLRIFTLTVIKHEFLLQQGNDRVLRLIASPAFRGVIKDRNEFPLAVSTKVFSIWINPQEFIDAQDVKKLAALIHLNETSIKTAVSKAKTQHKEFMYLKRGVSPEIANQIKLEPFPGVYIREEFKRFYPEGEITAHIIGFTNIDDKGQEGIELGYDHWLSGVAGKKWVIKDRLGRIIDDVKIIDEQKPGNDITLSVDKRLQFTAYRELITGINDNKAIAGSVVILDVKTGEILAMVNLPSFNPNNRYLSPPKSFRNRAVTDIFEPGSTIKAFTVASGLESRKFTMNSKIDTSPGRLRIDKNEVKDLKNNGVLSLAQILQLSSNVGAAKIVLSLPHDQLWGLLHRFGFGEITGIGFPGEQAGKLVKHDQWGPFGLATLSFGYGMSVTTLQLARAYAILATGFKVPLSLLKIDEVPEGEQVLKPDIVKQMLVLLETVTATGTGKLAQVSGYRVAGKSGTTKIVGKDGYEKNRYISSFVGIAPLNDPKFVVAVVLHDPQGKNYYGGLVAGPVFARIMQTTLRLYNIPPDKA